MSHEYKLVLENTKSANSIMDYLIESGAFVQTKEQEIHLKYRRLQTFSSYDVRLTKEKDKSI